MATPKAPLNLRRNRRTAPHSQRALFGDDELARELGEEFVRSVTTGEHSADDIRDEEVSEEHGGPFVTTSEDEEFAAGYDESNPPGAEPAAEPTVSPLRRR